MIPLRDVIPSRTTPYLTVTIIVLNVLAWFFELALPADVRTVFLQVYGVVPADFHATTLITSMFLHGGWMHVLGNMWYLYIFGDNIEDYLGHFTYLVFYVLCGLFAMATQVAVYPHSNLPTVGASGAIAGILGAYFIVYPRARVLTWFFVFVLYLPAWIVLGEFFVLNFFSGATTLSMARAGDVGGVAVWAHVGGFVAGLVMIKLFPERARRTPYAYR